MKNVAVLGASNKPDRYSFRAVTMLKDKGYNVFPIHPRITSIKGIKVLPSLDDICETIDTLSIYVGPARIAPLVDSIIKLNPKRVLFSPGTEYKPLEEKLKEAGIPFLKACTLVMLSTGQF